ncbi:MAG: hypothetical protein JNJ55_02740 [Betaproteobacteria bacterium]|nr:hypothetical protein [Betaproteobacteria bacterium]
MKKIAVLTAALLMGIASVSFAEPPKGEGPGPGKHPPRDCSKAPDAEKKARCEAHQAAMKTCEGKEGDARKACMKENMPKKKEG